jgi:hypothetical protein
MKLNNTPGVRVGVPPPEFREVSWGVDSTMRPCNGMAVSEYAFRQWVEANGIMLADGVALPAPTEREQTLAGLLKRCARCLPPDHATRKLATDYLKQQGFFNVLRGNAGVTEGAKHSPALSHVDGGKQ